MSALYAWGGPGTIRLLQTKYFHPNIDTKSYFELYDKKILRQAKEVFGTTDIFVTYSWGFSDKTEQQDKLFLRKKLPNFASTNIRSYAYVQGLNVVYEDWKDTDLFCRNDKGRIIPYSKGRANTCPNNPSAVTLITRRVAEAAQEDVYGVFVDNIVFGIPPIYIYKNRTSFFGCSCIYCQKEFKRMMGYSLPLGNKQHEQIIQDYLKFRANVSKKLIKNLSDAAKQYGKVFGVNLYDPLWYSSLYYMGYELTDIEPYLDYFLIENHALNKKSINNQHLVPHILSSDKPTFVVSYRKGIGRDSEYSQEDYNHIFTESKVLHYVPCYKATEFKTKKRWHALYPYNYTKVTFTTSKVKKLKKISSTKNIFLNVQDVVSSWIYTQTYKQRFLSKLFIETPLYSKIVRQKRMYTSLEEEL